MQESGRDRGGATQPPQKVIDLTLGARDYREPKRQPVSY